MEIKKAIFYNTFISASAKIINVVIGLVIISLVTRYLGQNSFGEFSTILAFLFVFSVFADLGLYSITLREISKTDADEKRILGNVFSLRFISGLLVIGLAVLTGLFFPYSQQIKIGILIAGLGYWAMLNTSVLMTVFQKYLKMEKVAYVECFSRLIQLGMIFFFIQRDLGFLSVIWAFSLNSLLIFFILFFLARKYIPFGFEIDFSFWKKILLQGYPLALGAVLTMFYFRFDTVLLSLMKSSADVGIYSLPYRVLEVLIFFPSVFAGLIMPLMSKYVFLEPEKFRSVIQKSFDFLLIVVAPIVAFTLFLSKQIVLFLGGPEFIKSVDVLNILIVATAIIFISNLLYTIIIVLEKQKSFIWIFAIGAAFNIVFNLLFIPGYSYYATSVNTVLTELLVVFLMFRVIFWSLRYLPSFQLLFKIILASLPAIAALYFFSAWHFLILIPLALAIYLCFLFLLGGLSKEEIQFLWQKENLSA